MSTYSFQDVSAALVGPNAAISMGAGVGSAEEGISVSMTQDRNVMRVGADGEGMHSLRGNKSGTVTVRLLKTSPANAQLMAAYNAQQMSSALCGKNVITVRNSASDDLVTARECAFTRAPDLAFAQDGDIVQWQFHSIKVDYSLGEYE